MKIYSYIKQPIKVSQNNHVEWKKLDFKKRYILIWFHLYILENAKLQEADRSMVAWWEVWQEGLISKRHL